MRYKEFNPNNVLEKCINLFWKNGYRACSVKDIVEVTNVNRYSLYDEFESKEGIFKRSLNLYKKDMKTIGYQSLKPIIHLKPN